MSSDAPGDIALTGEPVLEPEALGSQAPRGAAAQVLPTAIKLAQTLATAAARRCSDAHPRERLAARLFCVQRWRSEDLRVAGSGAHSADARAARAGFRAQQHDGVN